MGYTLNRLRPPDVSVGEKKEGNKIRQKGGLPVHRRRDMHIRRCGNGRPVGDYRSILDAGRLMAGKEGQDATEKKKEIYP